MKIKLTKLQGSDTVNIGEDGEQPKMMKGKEMIIDIDNSVTICDNPFNTLRCIVKIEVVKEEKK